MRCRWLGREVWERTGHNFINFLFQLLLCRFLLVIIDPQKYPRLMTCRYYARLLAPFILSPLRNRRKEANDEGRIAEQESFGWGQGSFYWDWCSQRELACYGCLRLNLAFSSPVTTINPQGWRLMAEGAWTVNLRISSITPFGTGSGLNGLMLLLSLMVWIKSTGRNPPSTILGSNFDGLTISYAKQGCQGEAGIQAWQDNRLAVFWMERSKVWLDPQHSSNIQRD